MRWARHVARTGGMKNVYKILVGKPEGKRPLGITRRRWEEWMRLAQDRYQCRAVMNTVMKLRDLDYLASYE